MTGSIPHHWHSALAQRADFIQSSSDSDCFRILHSEDPRVMMDRYGTVCWYYWFADTRPTAEDIDAIARFTEQCNGTEYAIKIMHNRGSDPHSQDLIQSSPFDSWCCVEHGITFELRAQQGLSPGLFLDQKANRAYVKQRATNRRMLNLFAYTGGFAVCALKGKAKNALNVDTSKASLLWAEKNAQMNGVSTSYRHSDVRSFLERACRRNETYDLIVCDPPSFARSKKNVFRIEHEIDSLIKALLSVLAADGEILFSCNYARWTQQHFFDTIRKAIAATPVTLSNTPALSQDFHSDTQQSMMKSCLLRG